MTDSNPLSSLVKESKGDDQSSLCFNPQIEAYLHSLHPSMDAMDAPDFSLINFINQTIPSEAALDNIDSVISNLESSLKETETELEAAVFQQITQQPIPDDTLDPSQLTQELIKKLSDIADRASQAEAAVQELCEDVQRLETARTNASDTATAIQDARTLSASVEAAKTALEARRPLDLAKAIHEGRSAAKRLEPFATAPRLAAGRAALEATCSGARALVAESLASGDAPLSAWGPSVAAGVTLAAAMGEEDESLARLCSWQLNGAKRHFGGLEDFENRCRWLLQWLEVAGDTLDSLSEWDFLGRVLSGWAELTCAEVGDALSDCRFSTDEEVGALLRAVVAAAELELHLSDIYKPTSGPEPPRFEPKGSVVGLFKPHLHVYVERERTTFLQLAKDLASTELDVDGAASAISQEEALPPLSGLQDLLLASKRAAQRCARLSTGQELDQIALVIDDGLADFAAALTSRLRRLAPQVAQYRGGKLKGGSLLFPTVPQLSRADNHAHYGILLTLAAGEAGGVTSIEGVMTELAGRPIVLERARESFRELRSFSLGAYMAWTVGSVVGHLHTRSSKELRSKAGPGESGRSMAACDALDEAVLLFHRTQQAGTTREFVQLACGDLLLALGAHLMSQRRVGLQEAQQLKLDSDAVLKGVDNMPALVGIDSGFSRPVQKALARMKARIGGTVNILMCVSPEDADMLLLSFPPLFLEADPPLCTPSQAPRWLGELALLKLTRRDANSVVSQFKASTGIDDEDVKSSTSTLSAKSGQSGLSGRSTRSRRRGARRGGLFNAIRQKI